MTNTNGYSFTSFLSNNKGTTNQGNTSSAYQPRKSDKMITYYMDLCRDKKIRPKDINPMTSEQLSKEIEQLRALPYPPSDAQMSKIKELVDEISEIKGKKMKLKEGLLESLTGGRNGTASKLIQTLFEKRKQLNELAHPTEQQIKTLVEWFFCPDIPFEDHGIQKKIYLEKLSYWGTDYSVPEELETRPWRLVTPDEFAKQIKQKLTQQKANEFISAHRGKFYDWKKTRITQNQINTIRNIEKELADLYTYKEVQTAVDIEGEEVEIALYTSRDKRTGMESAYEPLDEAQLIQMSYQEASDWIYKLSSERDDDKLRNIGSPFDDSQGELNDKLKKYDDSRTRTGEARDLLTARTKEYTALNDLLFKLESVVGYADEELHDLIKESIIDMKDDKSLQTKERIKEFMMQSIDRSSMPRMINDVGRLYTMSEDTLIGTSIVQEIADEVFKQE